MFIITESIWQQPKHDFSFEVIVLVWRAISASLIPRKLVRRRIHIRMLGESIADFDNDYKAGRKLS
jgi:hypothetical protein